MILDQNKQEPVVLTQLLTPALKLTNYASRRKQAYQETHAQGSVHSKRYFNGASTNCVL